jgi:hypothetical protein
MSSIEWSAETEPVDRQIGEPPVFKPPTSEELIGCQSWERAQTETDHGGPLNDAERMVHLDESGQPRRVVFVLDEADIRAQCGCKSWKYRQWCAHVAACWWNWVRGRISVTHRQTGREYQHPPSWLSFGGHCIEEEHLDGLTSAELDALLSCELGEQGVREYARHTDRSPGTVGNLLSRARRKVENGVVYTDGGQE